MAQGKKKKQKKVADDKAADCRGDGSCNCNCQPADCRDDGACQPEPTGKALPNDPVADRLKELEKSLGQMSTVVDEFEAMLGLCERMATKSRRIASMGERLAVWPPLTLLHSAASVAKRDIMEELERFAADAARLGAEYRLLKGEQRERGNE